MPTEKKPFDIDEVSDEEIALVFLSLVDLGRRIAAHGDDDPGVMFITGLYTGLAASQLPNYGTPLRQMIEKARARAEGISPEQVQSMTLQSLHNAVKGTMFED